MQFSIIPFVNLVNKGKIFWYCKEQGWCQRQHLPVSHASYLPRKSAKSKWWGAVHPSLAIVSICSMAYKRQLVFFSYHWHDTDANTDISKYMAHMMSKYFETGEMWRQQQSWLRVRVQELGKFQMNLLRVELAPTALKALQPLWTVWRKLQLHLVVSWTWMWNVFCEMKGFQKLLATSRALDIFLWTQSLCDCLTFWDVVSY